MRRTILIALLAACASGAVLAQTPKEQLLQPPSNAEHYVNVSTAGKHGDLWHWTLADGTHAYRFTQSLRGWITDVDETVRIDDQGYPVSVRIRGISPNGDQAETYSVSGDRGQWLTVIDQGSAAAPVISIFLTAALHWRTHS